VVRAAKEDFFPRGEPVLDVGCGAGSNVLWLAKRGFAAHGVDLSSGAVAAARSRAEKTGVAAEFRTGDALALPFARSAFGAALDHGCFHTLPIGRRPEYVEEIRRVVRPGGSFLLVWVAREYRAERGPPHRPSLQEIVRLFERDFLFSRTEFRPQSEEDGLPSYAARMLRRSRPQPPPR
jgi:SAM-dependent methyltransferase